MTLDPKATPQDRREIVWLTAWCAVANANDCKKPEVAAQWANACLEAFDKQFPVIAPQLKDWRAP